MIHAALSWFDRRHMGAAGGAYLNTRALYGTYRCAHRSHRLRLRCLRYWVSSSMCPKHLVSCYSTCER